jgi:glutamine---fructose-6-phosphate transaminase (isomerizing)
MCGIVGYVGKNQALTPVIEGLRRLEYRGYDSAGIALALEKSPEEIAGTNASQKLWVEKKAGKLANLESHLPSDLPKSHCAIGHTRWATHGGPTDENAHPHLDNEGKLAVIHNGIIENYLELRKELEARGHVFTSQTDTESVAHLLSDARKKHNGDLAAAMRDVCGVLRGSFTLLALHADNPDVIVGARRNSPLVVGRGDGENFLASDVSAFIAHTKNAIELGQDEVAQITSSNIEVTDLKGNKLPLKEYEISWSAAAAERGGYEHFMLKEIFEQPKAIADTLIGRVGENANVFDQGELNINEINKVVIVACGTAYHAGLIGKYAIEAWAQLPVDVELASEYRYREPYADQSTLIVPISQSGETMDTLMAMRYGRSKGAKVIAICNTQGATIARESDGVIYTHAGPEIAVASTKAFETQVVACYLLALQLGKVRKTLSAKDIKELENEIESLPNKVEQVLETVEPLRELTRKFKDANSMLFLGRHVGFPTALEGALKLKELAYMHAEGFAGGELKHGPIALIDQGTPVVAIMPPSTSLIAEKMASNIQEVKARGAVIIQIGDTALPSADHFINIPTSHEFLQPVLAVVPLQVIAYEMAVARGNDVDQPRNLAKSVTVE